MDDTMDRGFGPVSYMSEMLFGSAVAALHTHHEGTLKKLVRYCRQEKWSANDLTFDEVALLQKVSILDQNENINEEARRVILSLVQLTKDGALKMREDAPVGS